MVSLKMGLDCWGERVKVILYQYTEGTLMVCAHLEGSLLTKAPASGTWRPAKTSPRQTACMEASRLTCREDVVTEIKARENRKDSKRERGYLFGYIFLGQSKRKSQRTRPPRRERQSVRRRGNAGLQNWQLRRLCNLDIDWWELLYLRAGITLVLWQQSQKGFGRPQNSELQLVAILKITVAFQAWFKSPWVSIDRKPNLLNCEWAVGIRMQREVWGET